MKSLYLFALLTQAAVSSAFAHAQRVAVTDNIPSKTSDTEIASAHPMTFSAPAKPAAEENATNKISIRFNLDGEDVEPVVINFYNGEGEVFGTRVSGSSTSINLPSGKYDALCLFECNSSGSRFPQQSTIWVVNENIDTDLVSEVTFDVSQVKDPIKVRFVHADGSPVTLDKTTKNANGKYETVEKGNTLAVLHRVVLYADGTKIYMSGGGSFSDHIVPGEYTKREMDPEPTYDIWINKLSDRFTMGLMRMLVNEDCVEVIGMPVNDFTPKTLTNDPMLYKSTKASFVHTPAYEKRTEEYDFPYSITSRIDIPGEGGHLLSASTANEAAHNVKFCIDEANDPFEYGVQFALMDRIDVRHIVEEIIPGYSYEYVDDKSKPICSPWGLYHDGNLSYAVNLYDPFLMGDEPDFPGAPANALCDKNTNLSFGQGSPFTQFSFTSTYTDGVINPDIKTYSVGLGGELRSCDDADVIMSILVDGKESLSDEINTLEKWQESFDFAQSTPSEIIINYWHNNVNSIDDNGYTSLKSTINFKDGADSDYFPPLLNSLQFRTTDGTIVSDFDDASKAEMSIYAGDFNQVFGDELNNGSKNRHLVFAPLKSCKIEYAPHGTDIFTELNVEAIGQPSTIFGQNYKASLAQVNAENADWFDIKITLADDADNTQEQIMSPAFHISGTASLNSVSKNSSVDFSVVGRTIVTSSDNVRVYNVNGSVINSYNLQPGIYIVRSDNNVSKVVIR